MNNKMAINTYPSPTECKNQNKQSIRAEQTHKYGEYFDGCQMKDCLGGKGEEDEGIQKYQLVVSEQSWGCKVEHREYSQ